MMACANGHTISIQDAGYILQRICQAKQSNRPITTSNKKLVETSATLVVTGALLVVTRS